MSQSAIHLLKTWLLLFLLMKTPTRLLWLILRRVIAIAFWELTARQFSCITVFPQFGNRLELFGQSLMKVVKQLFCLKDVKILSIQSSSIYHWRPKILQRAADYFKLANTKFQNYQVFFQHYSIDNYFATSYISHYVGLWTVLFTSVTSWGNKYEIEMRSRVV